MMTELNNESKKYPISEIFVSPQGEGVYAGVLMCFVRLAGCTVGKPYPREDYQPREENTFVGLEDMPPKFKIYTEKCTLYDGRTFPCDTDYRTKHRMSPYQIMQEIPKNVKHVCITGGEPLMHNLDNLLSYMWGEDKHVHIETSGTIDKFLKKEVWVTVSPKFNVHYDMLRRADEIKILVDKDFEPDHPITALSDGMVQLVMLSDLAEQKPLYIQPVNFENEVNKENLQRCLDLQQEYPNFRVSPQMHKLFTAQTGQLVR
jgi:7-carboxy-7-deazaguanine synthase